MEGITLPLIRLLTFHSSIISSYPFLTPPDTRGGR